MSSKNQTRTVGDFRLSEIEFTNEAGGAVPVPHMNSGIHYACFLVQLEWPQEDQLLCTFVFNPEDDGSGAWVKFHLEAQGKKCMLELLSDWEVHEEGDLAERVPLMQSQIAAALEQDEQLAYFPMIRLDGKLQTQGQMISDWFRISAALPEREEGEEEEAYHFLYELSIAQLHVLRHIASSDQSKEFIETLDPADADEVLHGGQNFELVEGNGVFDLPLDVTDKIMSKCCFWVALGDFVKSLDEASQWVPKPIFLVTTPQYKAYKQWRDIISRFYLPLFNLEDQANAEKGMRGLQVYVSGLCS